MGRLNQLLLLLVTVCLPFSSRAQSVESLRALRDSGKLEEAAALLRERVAANPSDVAARRLLAETLSWLKQFDEAERLYAGLADATRSPDDLLAHARVLTWMQRYDQARPILEPIQSTFAPAREELARIDYWEGDLRSAWANYSALRTAGVLSPAGEKELNEIRAGMTPRLRANTTARRDDQPYDLATSEIDYSAFIDPLTMIRIAAGQHFTRSESSSTVPFFEIGSRVTLPRLRLQIEPALRLVRFGSDDTRVLPSLVIAVDTPLAKVAIGLEETEIISTRSSAATDVSERRATISLKREFRPETVLSISGYLSRYSDQNDGAAVFGYATRPLLVREDWLIYGGVSAAWRDTDESRFELATVSSSRSGGIFELRYRGIYDPYPTPHDQREAKLIGGLLLSHAERSLNARIQLTGGIAHDRAVAFGPQLAQTPDPVTFSFFFDRKYKPWDASVTLSWRTRSRNDLQVKLEHVSTAYYEANEVTASLVRRF